MKIGLLVGREYSFPPAFIDRVNQLGQPHGITAEYVLLSGSPMNEPQRYKVIVDRISHEVEYYRGFLKLAVLNGTWGIYGQLKDLSATDRNFKEDFYDYEVSMTVVGGELASNASGPISSDNPEYIALYNVGMRFPRSEAGIHFEGVLGHFQMQIFDALLNKERAVLIKPSGVVAGKVTQVEN